MKKRYTYIIFLKHNYDKINQTVPQHTKYWESSGLEDLMGGVFADKTGGIVSFRAENLDQISDIILNDPLNKQNLVENRLIKEWMIDNRVLSKF
jgi:uncharacterized protein YciI